MTEWQFATCGPLPREEAAMDILSVVAKYPTQPTATVFRRMTAERMAVSHRFKQRLLDQVRCGHLAAQHGPDLSFCQQHQILAKRLELPSQR